MHRYLGPLVFAAALALAGCTTTGGGTGVASAVPESPASGISVTAAGVEVRGLGATLPAKVAGLPVVQAQQLAPNRSDVVVRYGTPGVGVWTTVFAYKPPVPDPELVSLATEATLKALMGPSTGVVADSLVGPDGAARDMRVVLYGPVGITALTVMKSGDWILKARTSAAPGHETDLLPVAIAALRGIAWAPGTGPEPLKQPNLAACPALTGPPAQPLVGSVEATFTGLILGLAGGRGVGFNTDTYGDWCLDRPVAIDRVSAPLLRRRNVDGTGVVALLLLGDSGDLLDVIRVGPDLAPSGQPVFVVRQHLQGETQVLRTFNAQPDADVLRRLLRGEPLDRPSV